MTLRAAAEQALDTLEHVQAHIGRYDPPVVTTIARAMQPTIDALRAALAAEQPQPVAVITECEACFTPDVCQLRGTCDHYSTDWLRVAPPPAATEPSDAEVEAAWRAIPASHEDSRVSVITKGDVWVMLRAAAAARKA